MTPNQEALKDMRNGDSSASGQAEPGLPAANPAHELPAAGAVSPPMVTHAEPIRYGPWLIYRNDFTAHPDWRSVAWLYAHEDYDGPEDSRHGFGPTVEACIAEIQEAGHG